MAIIRNKNFMELTQLLRFSSPHTAYFEKGTSLGNNQLPFNRIFFVYGQEGACYGAVRRKVNGVPVHSMPLYPGHVYFMPKNLDLQFDFREVTMVGIHFSLEIFSGHDLFEDTKDCHYEKIPKQISEQVRNCMIGEQTLANSVMLQGVIMQISSKWIDMSVERFNKLMISGQRYKFIFDTMEKKPDAKLTVEYLSEQAGVSRVALSRAFANDMGIPLKKFITRQLIAKASEKLLSSSKKVREIAKELNFNDEYYFSRFYKKHKGCTPGEYRRNMKLLA